MHLHTLKFAALGPFPGEHVIDFSALGASGLFLLEGPTGSGKSTVIDAIVFALYGNVASMSSSSNDRLHSDHASADQEPFAELTFETSQGAFRVRRTPKYERARKRGSGTTTQQSAVVLSRLISAESDDGEVVSTRVGEADAEIQRAIGLTREQFVQTVILPQGEFAAFLRADTEARSKVLQKLFGTQIYEQMQAQLVQLRAESGRAVQAAQTQAQTALELFAANVADEEFLGSAEAGLVAGGEAGGTDGPGAVGGAREAVRSDAVVGTGQGNGGFDRAAWASELVAGLDVDAATTLSRSIVDRVADRAASGESAAASARAAASTARAAVEQAEQASRTVARHEQLTLQESQLKAQSSERVRWDAELDRARRAAIAYPLMEAAAEARGRLSDAESSLAAAVGETRPTLLGVLPEWTEGGVLPERAGDGALIEWLLGEAANTELATARDSLIARAHEVDLLLAKESDIAARQAHLDRAAEQLAERTRAQLEAETLTASDASRRAELLTAIDATRPAAAALPEKRNACDEASVIREAVLGVGVAALDVARCEEALAVAGQDAASVIDVEHALRRRWVAEIAGRIASELEPGQPCPVCGAVEHPSLATTSHDAVSDLDIESAQANRAAAESAVGDARAELVGARHRLSACEARLPEGKSWDLAAAESALVAAEAELKDAIVASSTLDSLIAELASHDEAATVRAESVVQIGLECARLSAQVQAEELAVEADRQAFASVSAGEEGLGARASRLADQIAALDEVRGAVAQVVQARRSAAEREVELRKSLESNEIDDESAVRSWMIPPAGIVDLDHRVRKYDAEVSATELALGAINLPEFPPEFAGDTAPALGAAWAHAFDARRDQLVAAEETLAEVARAAHLATDSVQRAEQGLAAVVTAFNVLKRCRSEDAPIRRIASLATGSGDGDRPVTLSTYVLMRRFEDVVAAANDRLTLMSDGRYELTRTDAKEQTRGGTRRTGLGLRIIDHVTDTDREPKTLSGGETFYVSLCLALGLADVVVAEAGGLDLGTLFVDEGFGTLDPEALDLVLTQLGSLREGGRVVGIVSHVEELKTRIAERVEVRRRSDGSSTLAVRA